MLWWEGVKGIIIITVGYSHKHCVLASLLHRQFLFSNSGKTVKKFFFFQIFFSEKEANHLWYQMAVLLYRVSTISRLLSCFMVLGLQVTGNYLK